VRVGVPIGAVPAMAMEGRDGDFSAADSPSSLSSFLTATSTEGSVSIGSSFGVSTSWLSGSTFCDGTDAEPSSGGGSADAVSEASLVSAASVSILKFRDSYSFA